MFYQSSKKSKGFIFYETLSDLFWNLTQKVQSTLPTFEGALRLVNVLTARFRTQSWGRTCDEAIKASAREASRIRIVILHVISTKRWELSSFKLRVLLRANWAQFLSKWMRRYRRCRCSTPTGADHQNGCIPKFIKKCDEASSFSLGWSL